MKIKIFNREICVCALLATNSICAKSSAEMGKTVRGRIWLYYGRKIFNFLVSMLFLSVAVFFVARLAPGDPLRSYYGDRVEKMSPEERERAEERLGLKEPVLTQYIRWLEHALQGDFGISYKYKRNVSEVIGARLGNTLMLGGISLALILILAPGLGIWCAWHEDKWQDRLVCRAGTVLSCIPEFWLSLVLVFIFAVSLRWLPGSGACSPGREDDISDRIQHLILPLAVAVTNHLWYYAYMIRNRILEEARAEYVLLARSKGLSKRTVFFRHCLRNVLPVYLGLMAISVPHILGGTYIVEMVFSYPGIGTLAYESVQYQDYNMLMLLSMFSGILVMTCSAISRTINAWIDPGMKNTENVLDGR